MNYANLQKKKLMKFTKFRNLLFICIYVLNNQEIYIYVKSYLGNN